MDIPSPSVQQRGFDASPAQPMAIRDPPQQQQVSLLTASLQHYSLLSQVIKRETGTGTGTASFSGFELGEQQSGLTGGHDPEHWDGIPRRESMTGPIPRPVVPMAPRSPPAQIPKPILRRPSTVAPDPTVPSTVPVSVPLTAVSPAGYTSEPTDTQDPPPVRSILHVQIQHPQPEQHHQQKEKEKEHLAPPLLTRKTSLKFAIAPPPIHVPNGPPSRRGSADLAVGPSVAGQDLVTEVEVEERLHLVQRRSEDEGRVIGDIQEEEDEDGEGDEDENEDEEEEEGEDEYNEDTVSVGDNDDNEDSEADEEDDEEDDEEENGYSGNWSGYEEDSEAGLSDELEEDDANAYIQKNRIVSPGPKRRSSSVRDGSPLAGLREFVVGASCLTRREEGEEDVFDVTHASRSPRAATPATHFSSIPSPTQHPSFAFARPTNYRRRRPASLVSTDGGGGGGGGGLVGGGSVSSLIAASSFVKIDPQERLHRGRGAVQILDPIPQGAAGRTGSRKQKHGTDTLTRHCSPPPAKLTDRSRSSSRSALAPAPTLGHIASIMRRPPAELSPSAIRMQVRRGYSDSPRKKKQRGATGHGHGHLFGPDGRALHAAMTTDDDVRAFTAATEDELAGPARGGMTATRGWRSDDALFAVPTVQRRYPAATAAATHHVSLRRAPGDLSAGSRKGSIKSLTTYPALVSSATPSDVEHVEGYDRSISENLVDGVKHVFRRASEKVGQPFGQRRPSTSSAQGGHQEIPPAATYGLLSPIEPSIAFFGASAPCPPAVDDTPALASAASVLPATPVDQLLLEKLAGTPSRRRGSDAAHVTGQQVKSAEGSGSDGYRSRASSALGFRSDDGKSGQGTYQQHKDSVSYTHQHQQHHQQHNQQQHTTTIHTSRGGQPGSEIESHQQHTQRTDPVSKGFAPTSLLSTGAQTCKSKPIKCPSPRRRNEHEVRI